MINRGREIAKMMGYETTDALLAAMGSGELILIKLPEGDQLSAIEWLHAQLDKVEDEGLAAVLEEIAAGLELALELHRYPPDSDVCEMDLPHGWPSYCEKPSRE